MELVLDILLDAARDTLSLVPFLFATYLVLGVLEVAASERINRAVQRAGAAGPVVGALAGIVPQCGFSAMGATLYASRVVTLGTLVAVFLSTSDELLPLLVAEHVDALELARILGVKALLAGITGVALDLGLSAVRRNARLHRALRRSVLGPVVAGDDELRGDAGADEAEADDEDDPAWTAVSEVCALRRLGPSGYPCGEFEVTSYDEPPAYTSACGCGCEDVDPSDKRAVARFALGSAVSHTVQVTGFIFLVTLVLVAVLETVGEAALAAFLSSNALLATFGAALVGLIPNCAASVVITQLYLDGVLGFGPMIAGSLVSVGVGFLVLFRANESARENVVILGLLWVVGVFWGLVLAAIGL